MLVPEHAPARRQGPVHERVRGVEQAQVAVAIGEDLAELGVYHGLILKLRVDALDRGLEDRPVDEGEGGVGRVDAAPLLLERVDPCGAVRLRHAGLGQRRGEPPVHVRGQALARLRRVHLREHVLLKLRDEFQFAGALRGLPQSHARPDHAGDEEDERRAQPDDQAAVAAAELRELVPRAGGSRGDRLVLEVAADVGGQTLGGLVAPGLVLFERLGDDGLDIAAQRAVDAGETGRLFFPDDPRRLVDHLALQIVRQPAGEEFVRDHAQRVDIAARVQVAGVAADLLGAHVRHGADKLSDVCLKRRLLDVGVGGPGDAEVQDLGLA